MLERDGRRVFNPRWLPALDSPWRDHWQQPACVLDALALRPGAVVADVGAGGGYFTEPLARRVGATGRVYATDVQDEMLDALRKRAEERELENVAVIRAAYDDPSLPDACCDLVFLANVYKEIDERVAWLRRLRRALRPGGRVAIIGFHPDAAGFGPPREVRLPTRTVEAELHASGFALHQSFDFLPRQYFLVFVPR